MNRLSFQLVEVEGSKKPRVMPCIDGKPLAALAHAFEAARNFDVQGGYGGIVPQGPVEHFPADPEESVLRDPLFGRTGDGSAVLLECMCGVEGCWPFLGRVRLSGTTVTWDEFCQPRRPDRDYTDFGPFTFEIQSYLREIRSVVADASGLKWSRS